MVDRAAPWHAHIYFTPNERTSAEALRDGFANLPAVLFVGAMTSGPAGPHPVPQFEVHFLERDLPAITPMIEASGLRALVHPLTQDDLADHTTLGRWIGEPLDLDLSVLDPPGRNKGVSRFGKADF